MQYWKFTELVDAGEGLTVEFKRKVSTPEKIARELIAFANTSGGVVLFGIDDDKSVVGVESEKGELGFIEEAASELSDPPIPYIVTIFNVRGRDVICVEVAESKAKPHFLVDHSEEDRKAYVRVGENSIQASVEMIKVLRHQSGVAGPVRLVVGEAERRLFAWFESRDRITVREYAALINVSDRRASRLLIRLLRAGVLAIHTMEKSDYFTLTHLPS
jgi:predicted HTH transcriptional regulator